jgi:spermidine/putrescine transport system ATP-binding protein
MCAGRFEQVGSPTELYYRPRTAFVAGFVGSNNRLRGRVVRANADAVELESAEGLRVRARPSGQIAEGDAAEAFIRPEAVQLARDTAEFAATAQSFAGRVESLLFDGANSSALVREARSDTEFRVALPQTGRFAELRAGEAVAFGFEAERAVCFRSAAA